MAGLIGPEKLTSILLAPLATSSPMMDVNTPVHDALNPGVVVASLLIGNVSRIATGIATGIIG